MTRTDHIRPDLDDGIDRKVLGQLRARFLKVTQARIERACEGFSSRQRQVLTLLPLLFHVNHPLLPGYVSGFTPAGISGYEPDEALLAEAQRLTRSFIYKHRRNAPTPILGLYLMGSLGTLAQDEHSDMDMWVCHSSDLDAHQRMELEKKCRLLEAWAETQGAEAHFFLIDCERFVNQERENQLSADDSGSTQHFLLLDEFYRTALWLAGRIPLWWMVPAEQEQNYLHFSQTLLGKRFVREDEVLDLGHLAHIPPGEFIGAGLWQLYKGIESPFKSVIKLLLIEVYAAQHPQVECLSVQFKEAIYANRLALDDLDPYLMVYRRIEAYLQGIGDLERLELVRRAFYLKVNKRMSGPPRGRHQGWQRPLMEKLVAEWGWDERQLAVLDSRAFWKVRQVSLERQALVGALNQSYRFIGNFSRQQAATSAASRTDLNILGRRLYAAFERRAGKLELINPGIAPDLSEDTLTLVQAPNRREPGQVQWGLFHGNLNVLEWEHFAPFKRSHSLIDLLAWGHRNGVIDAATRLALHPGQSDVTEFELFNLLGALQQAVPLPMPPVAQERWLQPAVATEVLLLVNVGVDPLKHHRDLNILMTTSRTDSLSYAGARDNLVLTLDQVTVNSWNEVSVNRFDGRYALLDCLRDLLNSLPEGRPWPRISVRCFCHNRAQAIAARVVELLETAQTLLARNLGHRYLIQVQEQYHVLDLAPGQVRHFPLPSQQVLLDYLSRPLKRYSPLHMDPKALQEHDLALILPHAHPNCVQVFHAVMGDEAQVYVLDEFNTLWRQRQAFFDEPSLLAPLRRFLTRIADRRATQLSLREPQQLETIFYRLNTPQGSRLRQVERLEPSSAVNEGFYEVQAILFKSTSQQTRVVLYCNQREFNELEHGEALYRVVAEEILSQRSGGERYHCYITDLDLSALGNEQTLSSNVYLRYKADLEQAINQALAQH
ncbi:class I adenylate cyclase [Pseudomonas sp. NPDC007930]|uniref:class I adenylate cyclase n=1 Tax=Pseudomonas sp. NPDC007930 TaxID=3364417 RepID=UPI0036EBBE33